MPKGRRGPGVGPYKLAFILLYGQHDWLNREGPHMVVPIDKIATNMRTRPTQIKEWLYLLENWGILKSVTWYTRVAIVQLMPPVAMAWTVGDSLDVQ